MRMILGNHDKEGKDEAQHKKGEGGDRSEEAVDPTADELVAAAMQKGAAEFGIEIGRDTMGQTGELAGVDVVDGEDPPRTVVVVVVAAEASCTGGTVGSPCPSMISGRVFCCFTRGSEWNGV
ncbi:hypothetical protein U1Q18_029125 [Sarracenia purpurea var. burkii]